MTTDPLFEEEVNLVYALLDATEGAMNPEQRQRWRECQSRFNKSAANPFGPDLYRLLGEISAAGGLRENWIQQRWLALRTRISDRNSPRRRR
jgi:hypothetical protein